MLYSFFLNLQKMLGVALPFGFATPTFIIEPNKHNSHRLQPPAEWLPFAGGFYFLLPVW